MSTRADKRKFHYIYKITRVDGKYYIGMHSTDDLEDGYFGSGQKLWKSIKKHGRDKHSKQILEFLPTRGELKERERELVSKDVLKDPMCMNLALGGSDGPRNEGKKRTLESRNRMKLIMKGKFNGEKNPNYGLIWVRNKQNELRIKPEDLNMYTDMGYWRGRLDVFGSSRIHGKRYEFISPDGQVFIAESAFKKTCKLLGLNFAKMREFINHGPIPINATRVQTRNCVGWCVNEVTITI